MRIKQPDTKHCRVFTIRLQSSLSLCAFVPPCDKTWFTRRREDAKTRKFARSDNSKGKSPRPVGENSSTQRTEIGDVAFVEIHVFLGQIGGVDDGLGFAEVQVD